MTTENMYYNLGKRDAVAEILMMFRTTQDANGVMVNLAKQLPDNPHAKWILKEFSDIDGGTNEK